MYYVIIIYYFTAPFQLTIEERFPDTICDECINKIDQINEFSNKVKENEQTLESYAQNGTLESYYRSLKNGFPNKHENKHLEVTDDVRNDSELLTLKGNEDTDFIQTKNTDFKVEDTMNNDFEISINNSMDGEDDSGASNFHNHPEDATELVKNTFREVIEIKESTKTVLDQYSCLTCSKTCETHVDLREHYNKEHTNKNNKITEPTYTKTIINGKVMYKCDVCSKIYSKKYLNRHLLFHKGVRPYVCRLCCK